MEHSAQLRPGGLLIIEGRQAEAQAMGLKPVSGGPPGYATNQLLHVSDKLRVQRYEDRMMPAEWSNGPEGKAPIVRLVARKDWADRWARCGWTSAKRRTEGNFFQVPSCR